MSLSRHLVLAPSVAILCVIFLLVGTFYFTRRGDYLEEAAFLFTFLYLITCAATLFFSFLIFPKKADLKRVKADLKSQLTAIKSGFGVTLAFIASIPLFSTEDIHSNAVMSDLFMLAITACGILAVPFFYSTHLLNLIEEEKV